MDWLEWERDTGITISVDLYHASESIVLLKENLQTLFSRCVCMFSFHISELAGQLPPFALGPPANHS